MAVGPVNGISENILHNFAKRLANNEPKLRRIALKKLRTWLQARSSSFEENDMLKIWKGLHYCFWMADKPVLQEELSESISSLLYCFNAYPTALLFTKAFFMTQAREWSGTDQLRMDKFMMLMRRMLRHSLILLRQHSWQQQEIVSFASTMHSSAIDGLNDHIPDGLRFHLVDIYLDELNTAGESKLTQEQVFQFVTPFCRLITKTSNKVLASYTLKTMLSPLLRGDPLKIDNGKLGDHLFKLAAKQSCRNRSLIYKFVNRCRSASIADSSDEVNMDVAEIDISRNSDEDAVNEILEEKGHLENGTKLNVKKKKRKSDENGDAVKEIHAEKRQLENAPQLNVRSKKRNSDDNEDAVNEIHKDNGQLESRPELNVKNSKKRKHQVEEEQSQVVMVDKKKKKAKRRKLEVSTSSNDSDEKPTVPENALDEEIEIWVPNRKYKGSLEKQATKSAVECKEKPTPNKSKPAADSKPFMTFVKMDKLPVALVKKAFHTPKTEPRPANFKISDIQGAFSTGQRKQVKFAKNLTQSQDFEDSLNLTPKPAFDPKIQPDRAILKTSASKAVNVLSRAPKKQLFKNKNKQKR